MALSRWEKFKLAFEIVEVRLRFVGLLIGSALLVGYWDTILNYADKWTRPPAAAGGAGGAVATSDIEYYCPMHPNVVRADSGNCPICGMNLSKRKKGVPEEVPAGVERRVQLSPARVRQAGVETSTVGYEVLFKEIRTVGVIDHDERRLAHLSARIAGRVDQLHIMYAGVEIKKGDPVYELYSPELVTTQEEYLLALKTLDDARAAGSVDPAVETRTRQLADSARKRMLLWGITEEQVNELERDRTAQKQITIRSPYSGVVIEKDIHAGHYVQVGEDPYTIADYSTVWMKAKVYEADASFIATGQPTEIRAEAFPDRVFLGTVAFISQLFDASTRTVDIRVDVNNRDLRLKPGMFVTATFRIPLGRVDLAVEPAGAAAAPNGAPPEAPAAAASAPAAEVWTCPMDPEVVSDRPGDCPKCGMHLVRKAPAAVVGGGGRAIDPARLVWFCPMHPGVYADKPGSCTTCGHAPLGIPPASPGEAVETGETCPVHVGPKLAHDVPCPICNSPGCYMQIEKQLAVPDTAVIDTGALQVVYLERSPGVFDAVRVDLGPRVGGFYPVTKGLKEGDKVVTQGSFLIDAESRLNPAAGAAFFGASAGPEAAKPATSEAK
ncbi:MAG: efflux RND transporter periplasmic adaptor subunit [Planctomycetes bacterium]|nr:efflux RND transporter periplasmic adaptor subunit [Planctomycetota bacterium]